MVITGDLRFAPPQESSLRFRLEACSFKTATRVCSNAAPVDAMAMCFTILCGAFRQSSLP